MAAMGDDGPVTLAERLAGPVVEAARALLGCRLTAGGVTVRLTEVEAYGGVGADPASHAHRGRTARNEVMFGPPGHLYVYFTYGMHWCANVVCGPAGQAAAVLLRAGEVIEGVDLARKRRPTARADRELARGPARLCAALGIDGTANGVNLFDPAGPVVLREPERAPDLGLIHTGPRVGVAGGHDTPWRFWLAGEPSVSPYRRHVPRRR
ncbi:MAG TPA: DNA-3-methyladenine glycosylase [Natronosporangium sp.]